MGQFFDKFPTISYTLSSKKYPSYEIITNILFRTAFLKEVLANSSSYTKYIVRDGDTPEILADKVYGNPEAHWIILYANQMIDPQYDWPMTTNVFYNYIVDKYRVMAEADVGNSLQDYEVYSWTQDMTNPVAVHHYEMVIKRENDKAQTVSETRFQVDKEPYAQATEEDMSTYYLYYDGLAEEQDSTPINKLVNGETVIQKTYRNAVTYFDYENELNESRRNIRIVKKQYYSQIMLEFNALTGTNIPTFFRRIS
jgi:hypothetical protein